MQKCLYVGLGGFFGSVCRYLLGMALACVSAAFPFGTLLINLVGSVIIGVISELSLKAVHMQPELYLFLTAGLCGGFTTFSTFSLETVNLFERGRMWEGVAYALASVLLCLLGAWMGKAAVRLFTF